MIILVALLAMMALGGVAFAFAGGDERTQKRVSALAKSKGNARTAAKIQLDAAQKRKSVATLVKDVEKNQAAMRAKNKPTLRRRLEQAGFNEASPRNYWIISGVLALVTAVLCLATGQSKLVLAFAVFVAGFGLPRWVLNFLFARRKKRFTKEFAPLVTSGPPGIAGYASGRPSARPAFAYWPTLVDASLVPPSVEMRSAREWAKEATR